MDGGEDWLLYPIRAGYLPWSALKDPFYDLEDFILASEALDVETENRERIRKAETARAVRR